MSSNDPSEGQAAQVKTILGYGNVFAAIMIAAAEYAVTMLIVCAAGTLSVTGIRLCIQALWNGPQGAKQLFAGSSEIGSQPLVEKSVFDADVERQEWDDIGGCDGDDDTSDSADTADSDPRTEAYVALDPTEEVLEGFERVEKVARTNSW